MAIARIWLAIGLNFNGVTPDASARQAWRDAMSIARSIRAIHGAVQSPCAAGGGPHPLFGASACFGAEGPSAPYQAQGPLMFSSWAPWPQKYLHGRRERGKEQSWTCVPRKASEPSPMPAMAALLFVLCYMPVFERVCRVARRSTQRLLGDVNTWWQLSPLDSRTCWRETICHVGMPLN